MPRHLDRSAVEDAIQETLDVPLLHAVLQVVHLVWRHKLLIIVGVLVFLGLGVAYHVRTPPIYRSDAGVLVQQKRPHAIPIPGADPRLSMFQDSLSGHQALLTSRVIAERAIERGNLTALKALANTANNPKFDPVAALLGGLEVTRQVHDAAIEDRSLAIFNLGYQCGDEVECSTILQAIIDAYASYLNEVHRSDNDQIHDLYVRWTGDIQTELKEKQEAYEQALNRIQPLQWRSEGGINLSEQRVADLAAQRLNLLVELSQDSERLKTLQKAREDKVSNEVLFDLVMTWTRTPAERVSERDQLFDLLLEKQKLTKTYGSKHREVAAVTDQIAIAARQVFGPSVSVDDIELMDPVEVYVLSLQRNIGVTEALVASLETLIEEEHTKAKEAHVLNEKLEQLRTDVDMVRSLQTEVIKKLQEVNAVKGADVVTARVLSGPSPGTLTAKSKAMIILPVAGIVGLLFGGGMAVLAEMLNQSFRTPLEVRRRLNLPVLGHIPYQKLKAAGKLGPSSNGKSFAPSLVAVYSPDAIAAEAYRGVRSALFYSDWAAEVKVIQVTSPNEGEGKSTLAANLAVSIAHANKRVLLVGADFRRPTLAGLFGLSGDVGLATVLAGRADVDDAIQPSGVPGLEVLPAGPPPPHPGEMLTSSHVKQLLQQLSSRYDFVLLDTPPILAVSDPSTVAAQVDGVLLTICNSKRARAAASNAVERLAFVGARVLGIVVKGDKHCSGPGGFGYEELPTWFGYSNSYEYYAGAGSATVPSAVHGDSGVT